HDLLVAAMAARDVDSHGDRLLGLVGDDDALAHAAAALDWRVDGRQRLGRRRSRPALGGFGAFLQAPCAPALGLALALGHPFCVTLLGAARRPRLARVRRARAAAAL